LFAALAVGAAARLGEFTPKALGETAWLKGRVYAKRLGEFAPQGLANLAWAYAAGGQPAPALFDALAAEATPRLAEFKPQELASLAWSFATAGHAAPALFDGLASRLSVLVGELFTAQGLSNTAWAFAAAGRPSPALFARLAAEATPRLSEFKPQELASLAWAFATVGQPAPALFDGLAVVAAQRLTFFKPLEVANVAWAFAAADHRTAPALFDEGFGRHVESLGGGFNDGSLVQLHQWALWLERECGRADGLPSEQLRARFHAAFASRGGRPSRLHKEVLSALASLRLEPAEHLQTDEGYTLDLVVEWRGEKVAVMVDAPWHFHNRQPTGHTLLRRRQLRHFGWRVLPLPHWEWSTLYHSAVADDASPQRRMQTYLLYALEQRVI